MPNTLANHGYLYVAVIHPDVSNYRLKRNPHDGRDINLDKVAKAVTEALNVGPTFGTKPTTDCLS
ncbi:hypothetical protein LZ31DRAFT_550549 [Colletotrichum somersetense]|nr:hypothetical protein LZ31DRAFT_550549 [Colletotrichum somersetense]